MKTENSKLKTDNCPTDKSSMLYWWPKVKGAGLLRTQSTIVPMPETVIVELVGMNYSNIFGILDFDNDSLLAWKPYIAQIEAAIESVGKPAFLRTDHISGKHDWVNTCYYDGSRRIESHIVGLVDSSDMSMLNVRAIVVREYVPMKSSFTAFSGSMPVCPERRYFVRDGTVECHHPYWIPDAIEKGTPDEDLPQFWNRMLNKMNTESDEEVEILTTHATTIAEHFPGYWSVDFCMSEAGAWFFIDMAEGEKSWHPECVHKEE